MIRVALPVLLLLAACGGEPTPPPRAAGGPDAELIAACRRAADREVAFRDRGQLGRYDEMVGSSDMNNTFPSMRINSDRGNQVLRRDALVEQCLRQNRAGPTPVDARSASTPPPRSTPTRTTRPARTSAQ